MRPKQAKIYTVALQSRVIILHPFAKFHDIAELYLQ